MLYVTQKGSGICQNPKSHDPYSNQHTVIRQNYMHMYFKEISQICPTKLGTHTRTYKP